MSNIGDLKLVASVMDKRDENRCMAEVYAKLPSLTRALLTNSHTFHSSRGGPEILKGGTYSVLRFLNNFIMI